MIEIEKVIDNHRILYFKKGTKILHREDGPALEYKTGLKEWYIHGKRHRVDGPAQIFGDGKLKWCLNGNILAKEAWFEALTEEQKVKAFYSEYFIRG
jgi:hypothetical protein